MKTKIVVVIATVLLNACAGAKLYTDVGIMRIDESGESQATHVAQTKPLICWIKDCDKRGQYYDDK